MNVECPQGGVLAFLNGFLLSGLETVGDASIQVTPYLRHGANTVELVPQLAGVTASLDLLDLAAGAPPDEAPVIHATALDPASPGKAVRSQFAIEADMPGFAWTDATPIEDVSAYRMALYDLARRLAQLLADGPDDALIALLAMKHREIADAVGLSKSEMDEGLVDGLRRLRERPDFHVDLAQFDDFAPVLSPDRRIVNLRRQGGEHAIRMIDGVSDPGFRVFLARLSGQWHVVR
jgi:hypothetical protein